MSLKSTSLILEQYSEAFIICFDKKDNVDYFVFS